MTTHWKDSYLTLIFQVISYTEGHWLVAIWYTRFCKNIEITTQGMVRVNLCSRENFQLRYFFNENYEIVTHDYNLQEWDQETILGTVLNCLTFLQSAVNR